MTETLSREIETVSNFNNKYISSPINNLNVVEMQLLKIFEDEVNSENPVISMSDDATDAEISNVVMEL